MSSPTSAPVAPDGWNDVRVDRAGTGVVATMSKVDATSDTSFESPSPLASFSIVTELPGPNGVVKKPGGFEANWLTVFTVPVPETSIAI
jgi:hypothetical protein